MARAVIAGFVALGVSTVALVIVSGVAGSIGEVYRGSNLLIDWMYELTHNEIVDRGRVSVFASLALHMAFGMVWAILYALVFEPRLRQYPGWQAGALFSLLPFFLSVVLFLPITGGGLFGINLRAGPLPLIGNLVLHLLFGATLGAGYSAGADQAEDAGDTEAERLDQSSAMGRAETSAARGILIGVVAGGGIGAVLGALLPSSSIEDLIGSWPIALGVAGALAGGSVGALIGSMAGLSDPGAPPIDSPEGGQPIAAALIPLAAVAMVAVLIVSIGSLLLTVAGDVDDHDSYYYGGPIVAGLLILLVVTVGATALDRGRPRSDEQTHDGPVGH